MKNIVAIIGRPNTGKSTLFNKILEKKEAIISDEAGTTRDIIIKNANWQGVNFKIFDTGGIDPKTKTNLEKKVQLQTNIAIEESNIILFLINIKEGIKTEDIEIANKLKKTNKKVILVASKADTKTLREESSNLYKIGFGKPLPISSTKGSGVGDLLDEIVSQLNKNKEEEIIEDNNTKISILGKPNVGKSSLFNAISKENKVIVSNKEGTTRDSVDTEIYYKNNKITITDTAGLRRKSKIKVDVERVSSFKSIENIKNSEICLLLLDATKTLARQDARIITRITENEKCLIIVVNKWDKIREGKSKSENKENIKKHIKYLKTYFSFVNWAPIVFISAKYRENISDLLEAIIKIQQERNTKISKEKLKKLFEKVFLEFYKNEEQKLKNNYFIQSKNNPTRFILYNRSKKNIPQAFINHLEKSLRKKYSFTGTPLEINVKKP